jgi:hypothetical protein
MTLFQRIYAQNYCRIRILYSRSLIFPLFFFLCTKIPHFPLFQNSIVFLFVVPKAPQRYRGSFRSDIFPLHLHGMADLIISPRADLKTHTHTELTGKVKMTPLNHGCLALKKNEPVLLYSVKGFWICQTQSQLHVKKRPRHFGVISKLGLVIYLLSSTDHWGFSLYFCRLWGFHMPLLHSCGYAVLLLA